MATAANTKTEVATAPKAGAVAAFDEDFLKEAEELGGAGRTKGMDDNVIPFLSLLQDMSPEAKKRDPDYVEGAEPGMILNKATKTVHTELIVIPWATDRCINQWVPRDSGGGFKGRHPFVGTVEDSMKAAGGTEKPDPKDPKKTVWMTADGDELLDTRYVYVMVVDEEKGTAMPAVISFSSTGHTVAKAWSTLRNASKLPGGKEHPIWFRKYRMKTKPAKNTKGDYFVLDFQDLGDEGWVKDKVLRDAGREYFEQFEKGHIKSADEADVDEDESKTQGGKGEKTAAKDVI